MPKYSKFGLPALVKSSLGNKSINSGGSLIKTSIKSFTVRVIEINLDPKKGDVNIGVVTGEQLTSNGLPTGHIITGIKPCNPYVKIFPLVNEHVYVKFVPAPNTAKGQFVYDPPTSLYGAAAINVNPLPSPNTKLSSPSQTLSNSQVNSGAYNISSNKSKSLNYKSPTYVEKKDIHPLIPFSGDVIYEGRWGQSLRFGSTSKTNDKFSNLWSSAGNSGDPIIILRNGQNPNSSKNGSEPIKEDINYDLSSIYLTSNQKIKSFKLQREESQYWIESPKFSSEYIKPQIILNSGQISINATQDSILLSSKQSIGLSCYKEISLISDNITIHGKSIKLGSKTAKHPALLGDKTVETLHQITTILIAVFSVLEIDQLYPAGIPIANGPLSTITVVSNDLLQKIDKNLNDLLSKKVKLE